MDSRKATYVDLLDDLSTLLAPQGINPVVCDIFAETILKAAGVESAPTRCEMIPDHENPGSLLFNIDGISAADVDTFNTFLFVTDGVYPFSDLSESGSEADAENEDDSSDLFHLSFESSTESTEEMTAETQSDETSIPATPPTPEISYDEEATVADDNQPDYQFIISIEHARQFLLPIFKRNFDLMTEEQIEQYQLRSISGLNSLLDDAFLKEMQKLDSLYAEIIRLTIELQSSSISSYTKGQLNIMLDDMVLPSLKEYHRKTKGHDCPAAISLLQTTNNNSKLYEDHVASDENLSGNETAMILQADVNDYIKTGVGLIELHKVRSSYQGLSSLIGLFGKQSTPTQTNEAKTEEKLDSSTSDIEPYIEALLPSWKV